MNDEIPYWLGLVSFRKFGARRLVRLAQHFGGAKQAFFASAKELCLAGIPAPIAQQFTDSRLHIDVDALFSQTLQHEISILTIKDEAYPILLKEIYDPPAVLFVRGKLPISGKHLAVVGSRHATSYGYRIVDDCVVPLAKRGVVIVSGLAYGIDAAAHLAAIHAGGMTICVLGSGVDDASIYPTHHRTLAHQALAHGGAVISEFPLGTHALPNHFPIRNRIIAGLCQATLIVEAAKQSGSLITARCALAENRDVFAVPGSIYAPLSEGPNSLIKMGAIPVTSPDDVFNAMDVETFQKPSEHEPLNETENALYHLLGKEPQHVDELVEKSSLPTREVTGMLSLMEIKGAAIHTGGMYYVRG